MPQQVGRPTDSEAVPIGEKYYNERMIQKNERRGYASDLSDSQ